MKNCKLNYDECLVSFDIKNLYTNVPVIEAINVCADLLFASRELNIDKDTFITLAKLLSCDMIFSSHDGFYTQVDGLAMGSAPAPHIANGWLSTFDSTIKETSPLYARYMDDILCSIKRECLENKLGKINNIHPSLSFTVEEEKEGRLPFLDMVIVNQNGQLTSGWYRKPTDTGLTLNFHSLAPLKYKKSVVIGFVYRIFNSCSTWQLFHEGLEEAKSILVKKQYPLDFIEKIFNDTLMKILSSNKDNEFENESDDQSINDSEISMDYDTLMCKQIVDKDKLKFFLLITEVK